MELSIGPIMAAPMSVITIRASLRFKALEKEGASHPQRP